MLKFEDGIFWYDHLISTTVIILFILYSKFTCGLWTCIADGDYSAINCQYLAHAK